jgi:RNA polymerase sigma-70 factor (ECF subfamily)
MVFQAHRGDGRETVTAQEWLLLRYYRSVFRYLRAMVRDGDTAEELTHEFVVRFLRGDFKRANPARGRFRDLLKRALRHLAIDHWRRKRVEKEKRPEPLSENWEESLPDADWRNHPPPRRRPPKTSESLVVDWRSEPPPLRRLSETDLEGAADDQTFLRGWRTEMLGHAWKALARFEEETRCSYHTALRARADHPRVCISELTQFVSSQLNHTLTEGAFRQLLRRARQKFADFLVAEVARSLSSSDPDAIEAELVELDLLLYCGQSIARLRKSKWTENKNALGDGQDE